MAVGFARLEAGARDVHHNLGSGSVPVAKPLVVLLHGLGGDCDDWIRPLLDRNWPYDHRTSPTAMDLGVHSGPPLKLPGVATRYFLSPRMQSNARGRDGSDDRSWWHALVTAGFPVVTYSQVAELMMPLSQGPVGQFKRFMETLQKDVLGDAAHRGRKVAILGHSRGGLVGRAYLGDSEVKADRAGRFPATTGLITMSSPHRGSNMALLDDRILGFLSRVQDVIPKLPNDAGNQAINALKAKADAYVGAYGDEIEPGSPMFRALEAQEPIAAGVRCISVAGTSPRFLRLYLWTFTLDSALPRRSDKGKIEFHWRAAPLEAKGASPIPDGLPLKLLGMDLDEVMPGRGDGLTAESRCRFPAGFAVEENMSFPLSHAEELWDGELQAVIVDRLERSGGDFA